MLAHFVRLMIKKIKMSKSWCSWWSWCYHRDLYHTRWPRRCEARCCSSQLRHQSPATSYGNCAKSRWRRLPHSPKYNCRQTSSVTAVTPLSVIRVSVVVHQDAVRQDMVAGSHLPTSIFKYDCLLRLAVRLADTCRSWHIHRTRWRQLPVVGGQSWRQQWLIVAAGHARTASIRVDCYEVYSSQQEQSPRRRDRQPNYTPTATDGRSTVAWCIWSRPGDLAVFSRMSPPRQLLTHHFCSLKRTDVLEFQNDIKQSELFLKPATTTDGFANQLDMVTTDCPNKHRPLQTRRKIAPICQVNRWLSDRAVEAKRVRRRLERKWKSKSNRNGYVAYHPARCVASKEITKARSDLYRNCIAEAADDPRRRWSATETKIYRSADESQKLCNIFNDKIHKAKEAVKTRLSSHRTKPLQLDTAFTGLPLDDLQSPTEDEVGS